MSVWDCCAASGGKSIMAVDVFNLKKLFISDVRETIISNLRSRLKEAKIKNYHAKAIDATDSVQLSKWMGSETFDFIICDAPCSGSGTWGRTPEQLLFFKKEKISEYTTLQKKIIANTVKYVAASGYFLYITCSVFVQENEDMVKYIEDITSFSLVKMELLKGYDVGADTMFAALFKKTE